jgi:hypothetical protein
MCYVHYTEIYLVPSQFTTSTFICYYITLIPVRVQLEKGALVEQEEHT